MSAGSQKRSRIDSQVLQKRSRIDGKDLAEEHNDGSLKTMDDVFGKNSDFHGDVCERKVPELSDDVIEKIVARMPFPLLYKARCLSRSWYLKFPLPYVGVKSWSRTLEQQLVLASSRWPVYCPVYASKDKFLGFDKRSHQWQSIPISYPKSCHPVALRSSVTGGGSMICVTSKSKPNKVRDFFVANVITKRWRLLPRCQYCNHSVDGVVSDRVPDPELVRILPLGADSYKVLLVLSSRKYGPGLGEDSVRTWVYDSTLKTWIAQEPRALNVLRFYPDSAYVDGKLYCLCKTATASGSRVHLRRYDIVENSWGTTLRNFGRVVAEVGVGKVGIIDGAVLQSGKRVLVVIRRGGFGFGIERSIYQRRFLHAQDSMKIYELILDPLRVKKVAKWSPLQCQWLDPFRFQHVQFAADVDFIYIGDPRPGSDPLITYNLHTHEWSDQSIPPARSSVKERAEESSEERYFWGSLSFEPGLNPFAEV